MKQEYTAQNYFDDRGNPSGGWARGPGISIEWQNGPLAVDGERREPNGAFVETLIAITKERIEHYQQSKFACEDNATAISHLQHALEALEHRTIEREQRGVEGTHEV